MASLSSDVWMTNFNACDRLGQDITEKVNERNRLYRNGSSYSKISVEIRSGLRQMSKDINSLKQNLDRSANLHYVTVKEAERRQNLLDNLSSREIQLNNSFRQDPSQSTTPSVSRTALLTSGFGNLGTGSGNPWDAEESEETQGMDISSIRRQQQDIIEEQDRGLETLSTIITRQKDMGNLISGELDEHNEIIDDLADNMDRADSRLIKETGRIREVHAKSGSCALMVVVVLLMIAIVVVAVVPYHHK